MADHEPSGTERARSEVPHAEVSRVSRTAAGLSGSGWLLIVAVLAMLALLAGNFGRSGNQAGSDGTELLRSVPAAGINSVEITVTGLSVNVAPTAGSNIEVELTGGGARQPELTVEQAGGTLQIKALPRNRFLGFLPPYAGFLTVGLPAGKLELLKADSSSGAITASGFTAVEAEFRSSSGSITVKNSDVTGTLQGTTSSGRIGLERVTAGNYRLSSSSGSIEASSLDGAVQASSSSGSISLTVATINHDWTLRSSSGSISVTLTQLPTALRVEYQASSGSWSVPPDWNLNVAGQPDNRLNAQIGTGGPLLSVTTSSGSFALR